ncbi:hypothetical protein TUM19329_33170 [Legionella antarctica]|uniref:Coiled-coil protein n=1 Tax=Legionella antarctica TaxID=2708020 RepID=A0A6F8TAE7_9GAMM|nr:hypothetical protein [Legionella antarctica]BCA96956.1 hypothetical protein TUM19329_33170 [Legionella antarctica]
MTFNQDEITAKHTKEYALALLSKIKDPVEYKLTALTQQTLLRAAAKKIPWLSRFLESVDDTGDAFFKIGDRISSLQDSLHDTPSNQTIGHAFHFGAVAMAAFYFIRIPTIYIAAYMLNEKIPITLDNNARWLYSGVLLALAITAITVPVAATVIGFVAASIGLTAGLFLLGRTLYERYQLGKEYKKTRKMIDLEEEEMLSIQQQAKYLEERINKATQEDELIEIYKDIALLGERYDVQYAKLEQLKNKELHLEQKMAEAGVMQVLDRGIGVCLSSITILGMILALFFPAVGLGILTGVAVTGGVYLAARLTAPLFKLFGNWLTNKIKRFPGNNTDIESPENKKSLTNSKEQQHDSSLGPDAAAVESNVKVTDKERSPDSQKRTVEQKFNSTVGVLTGLMGDKVLAERVQPGNEVEVKEKELSRITHLFIKSLPNGEKDAKKENNDNAEQESPP